MIVKSKYLIFFVLILSVFLIVYIVFKTNIGTRPKVYEASIYKYNEGYGYSISYNNKLVIKQDAIPVIETNQPFCNFNDAKKVANLVKEKLKNEESPNVSMDELKSLHIQLKCSY